MTLHPTMEELTDTKSVGADNADIAKKPIQQNICVMPENGASNPCSVAVRDIHRPLPSLATKHLIRFFLGDAVYSPSHVGASNLVTLII